ncbi:hypothetical protein NE670_23625, partial [Flavonifractor plautii]|uniref:hypothetical protein n=1 Tax=Flavonifractor plautii TaxID=292800 RepID=UPI002108DD09
VGRKRPTDSSEMIGMLGGTEFRLRRGFASAKRSYAPKARGAYAPDDGPTTAWKQERNLEQL